MWPFKRKPKVVERVRHAGNESIRIRDTFTAQVRPENGHLLHNRVIDRVERDEAGQLVILTELQRVVIVDGQLVIEPRQGVDGG